VFWIAQFDAVDDDEPNDQDQYALEQYLSDPVPPRLVSVDIGCAVVAYSAQAGASASRTGSGYAAAADVNATIGETARVNPATVADAGDSGVTKITMPGHGAVPRLFGSGQL